MATLSLTILKAKQLKDGKHKIRVAVRHHHDTCYIITPYIIDDDSEFRNGRVIKRDDAAYINVKLRTLLNEYQDILYDCKHIQSLSCQEVKDMLIQTRERGIQRTFQEVSKEYIDKLKEDDRGGYAELIERNYRYFTEFTQGDFGLDMITTSVIDNYSRFLSNVKKLGDTTLGMHMSRTRVVINYAKKMQYVKYDVDPFSYYHIHASQEREMDITVDDMRKIISLDNLNKALEVAKDTFLLSYYLGGINLVDMLKINFSNIKQIEYVRTKTRNTKMSDKRISITIQPEASAIIKKYVDKKGYLDFGYQFSFYGNFARYNTRNIKKLGKLIGIDYLCYYSARKSFVQHGFELGIPLEVLEYTIGQTMKANRPIFNYVRIMRKHADNAIRKILDNLKKGTDI